MGIRQVLWSLLFLLAVTSSAGAGPVNNLMRVFGYGWSDGRHSKRSCTHTGPKMWSEPPLHSEEHYPLTQPPMPPQDALSRPPAPAAVPSSRRGAQFHPAADRIGPALDLQAAPTPANDVPLAPGLQFPAPPPPPSPAPSGLPAAGPQLPSQQHVPTPVP